MSFTTTVYLFVCIQTILVYSQGQATGTCSTKEMRRDAVNKVLVSLGCDNNYTCAIQKALYLGVIKSNPAISCAEIFNIKLNAPPGYYWLMSVNGSAVYVFCDMTLTCKGVGGGWMQVAKLDMTNSSHQCPPGTTLKTYGSKRLCRNTAIDPGCSSSIFSVHGIKYSQVCGKIIAYQNASPDAFGDYYSATRSNSIDGNYVDGISLTHGNHSRNHIWTFAGDLDEVGRQSTDGWKSYCPCNNISLTEIKTYPPNFVGDDYFCDTGSRNTFDFSTFYGDDPLWDGAGCGPTNTCCSLNNPPWFLKQLPSTTTDDIEMRMCHDEHLDNEDTPIEIIELYVH